MKSSEEQGLNEILKEFTRAIKLFKAKDYKNAEQQFEIIIDKFKDSEYFSILEVQSRSKVYSTIIKNLLNPKKSNPETDQDYLDEGIIQLNSGNLETAIEYFVKLEKKKFQAPFVSYLLAIAHIKNSDPEKSLEYLEKAIRNENTYKVLAFNEPDFEPISSTEEFTALVEIKD